MYTCFICKKEKNRDQFYSNSRGKKYSYCKPCAVREITMQRKAFKLRCVQYKGGKCINCGYNKCLGALDFHHRDPTKKDFVINGRNFVSLFKNNKIKDELDKCDLLCSNCHRETHDIKIDLQEIQEFIDKRIKTGRVGVEPT